MKQRLGGEAGQSQFELKRCETFCARASEFGSVLDGSVPAESLRASLAPPPFSFGLLFKMKL